MKTQRIAIAAALHSVKKGDAVTINGRTFEALGDGGNLFDVKGARGARYGITINLKHRDAWIGTARGKTVRVESVGDLSL